MMKSTITHASVDASSLQTAIGSIISALIMITLILRFGPARLSRTQEKEACVI
jgi:hypothetical protein